MTLSQRQAFRWTVAVLSLVGGVLVTAAANEAWGLFGRVTVLEVEKRTDHELLMEMRQDIKEIRSWVVGK